jgi:excinuclease UvrABC ATPase subunit
LVDDGATVVVIEHDLEVVARADWVIDLGPGAGADGGRVVFEGPPAQIVEHPTSVTGHHLALRQQAAARA